METKKYFIPPSDFSRWVKELAAGRELVYPRKLDGDWRYASWEGESDRELPPSDYRAVESLKNFLFSGRWPVARFPPGPAAFACEPARVILGLKACDLACLPILDYIFLKGSFSDPIYARTRGTALLVSQDCTGFKEVCFCPLVGGRPHPVVGFDLNLSPVSGGFIMEVGSQRGEEAVRQFPGSFAQASPQMISERERRRAKVLADLQRQLAEQGQIERAPAAAIVKEKSQAPWWKEEAVPCVECGACNLVCPTCHCFILEELGEVSGSVKMRAWDSCQYPGFSREAGGANPRPRRWERLSNRFSKKFQFFPDLIGSIACTGCGRCVEACMGKIDLRKILGRIERGGRDEVSGVKCQV